MLPIVARLRRPAHHPKGRNSRQFTVGSWQFSLLVAKGCTTPRQPPGSIEAFATAYCLLPAACWPTRPPLLAGPGDFTHVGDTHLRQVGLDVVLFRRLAARRAERLADLAVRRLQ